MKPHVLRRNDIKALSPADRSMLCSVYLHRCLTFEQMYRFYYSKENSKITYAKWHLQEMLEKDFLLEIPYQSDTEENNAYFLSATGIVLAKRLFGIPSTCLPQAPDRCTAYHWHSKDLKLFPTKINHQVHLNTFALLFAERMGIEQNMSYLDEKFMLNKDIYSMRARPDGEILLPDQAIYLELDMNTERMKSLQMKWDGYRTLVRTNDFFQETQQYPVSMLFILDNVVRVDQRIKTVLQSLEKSCFVDAFNPGFDFYIGTPEEMLDLSFQYLIPHKPFELKKWVKDTLARRCGFVPMNPPKENGPYDFFGKIGNQLYGIDTYDRIRGSVLARLVTANRDEVLFGEIAGESVHHLVIGDNMDRLKKDVELMKCYGMKSNFYANIKDLETKPFQDALFRLDEFGNFVKGN